MRFKTPAIANPSFDLFQFKNIAFDRARLMHNFFLWIANAATLDLMPGA
jgi:hypothetical protein